ncbi:MAG: SufD family Fe-S cluster assembly protein [Clostridiales bacterium]|nr:SufD family Fe-S cluster assembly protein [Clostridiales bacterium]
MSAYDIVMDLVSKVSDITELPQNAAYNIRADAAGAARQSTENIQIITKTDKPGIDIMIKPGTKGEKVFIPAVITHGGVEDLVYNDFYVGEGADVEIIAGCGVHNCDCEDSHHNGIHRFFVEKNARVRYVEKHFGEGDGTGKRIINPVTEVFAEEGSYVEMDTVQIEGVDSTNRVNKATLKEGASMVVSEKIMTHGDQTAETHFDVEMVGKGSSCHLVSRSVAKDTSKQLFQSYMKGDSQCYGHSECDAIIMDSATVSAIPEVVAADVEAQLVHEATIGKIAGEQLIKLMTLGLTEEEAEAQIIDGFLK